MNRITLVLGGARSGKSRYAESLASGVGGRKTYVATAEAIDEEMAERIARHREQRGDGWQTVEAPLELAAAIGKADATFMLVDCITVWLNNLIHHGRDVGAEVAVLCDALHRTKGHVVLVSNEVGQGIVPDNPLARRFRDEQGLANQRLAEVAGEVVLVAAGLPLKLKSRSPARRGRRTAPKARGRRA